MKKRILVVDDELAIRRLLKFKLSRHGFEVLTAKNDKEFRDLAFSGNPDLIVLDIWLKNKIGTDVYHGLLDSGFDPEVPVIFITALMEDQPLLRHSRVTSGKYVLYGKPFDFNELMIDVKRLIQDENTGVESD